MYNALVQGDADCGFPGNPSGANFKSDPDPPPPPGYIPDHCDFDGNGTDTPERLAYIINYTACYGLCDPYDAAYNYYQGSRQFQSYNINEKGTTSLYYDDAFVAYLNRADVKTAIHAPAISFNKCNDDLCRILVGPAYRQPPPAYSIVPTLLSQGIKVHIFSGMLDFLIPHTGQDLVIQNMTWGGAQGFAHPPTNDILHDLLGRKVGAGRTERGLSYYTFDNAGHRVAQDAPGAALEWLQKVVIGGPMMPWWWLWLWL
jgi:carboxypeptidase D